MVAGSDLAIDVHRRHYEEISRTGWIAKRTFTPAAGAGFSTATDLADWLVRTLDMPFRDAHHVTGAAVKRAEALGVDLPGLPLAEFQALCQGITPDVFEVLTPAASAGSRQSYGGTAPDQVRLQAARWREKLS